MLLNKLDAFFWKRKTLLFIVGLLALAIIHAFGNGLRMIGTTFPGFWVHKSLITSDVILSNWTGYHSEIPIFSRILAINHQSLKNSEQFKQIIAQLPPDTPVTYTFRRPDGRIADTSIKTMRYTHWDFVRYNLLFLCGPFFQMLLALFVIFSTRDYHLVKHALGFGLIHGFVSTLFEDVESFHQFGIFSMNVQYLFPAAILHLGLFLNCRYFSEKVYRRLVTGIWATILIYSVMIITAYYQFHSDWRVMWNITWFDSLYSFDAILYLLGFGAFPFLVLHAYLKSPLDSLEKQQTRVILTGAIIGCFPLVFLLFIPMMLFGGQPWLSTEISLLGFTLFPFFIVYAMLRYKAFDIELYIRKAFQYYVLTIMLVGLFISGQLLLTTLLAPVLPVSDEFRTLLAAMLAFVLPYRLRTHVQYLIDRAFYRERLIYQSQVELFAQSSTGLLEARQILDHWAQTMALVLHPEWLAWYAKAGVQWQLRHSQGKELPETIDSPEDVSAEARILVESTSLTGLVVLGPRKSELPYRKPDQQFIREAGQILIERLEAAELANQVTKLSLQRASQQSRHEFLRDLTLNLSHDLKSPLANCHQVLHEIQEAPVAETAALKAGLNKLKLVLGRLMGYITMSLDQETFAQGRLVLKSEPVDLSEACRQSLLMHEAQYRRRGIALEAVLPEAGSVFVGDPMRFEHVVSNLLSNALRFARSRVSLKAESGPSGLLLVIEDDGPGIEQDQREQVFERYARSARSPRENKQIGTGLGLWICKTYLEKMGGSIRLASSESNGCRFEIRIRPNDPPLK